ncbi:protein Spindly-B [Lepeophtheirus salmonis]|uniref:protein Spindly-B n=1 Tax=Lepeophtheirus salmonis TaxID=72036 RepID=UPI001AE38D35|nr:protein Spindly-like [Lepeophtheirus salmonis]
MGDIDWESRYNEAISRATEAEKNMLQAASFGQILLSEKDELSKEVKELTDKLKDVQHNAHLKEETQILTIKSLEAENEAIAKEHRSKEDSWIKKMESLQCELRKARNLNQLVAQEDIEDSSPRIIQSLQEEIVILRKELDSCYALSSKGDSSSYSFSGLDMEELKQENTEIKEQLRIFKDELIKTKEELDELKCEKSTLNHEIREKDEEIQCYVESLDFARNSAADLHQEIESLQINNGETSIKKGNSLFSEVEDRRNFVEQKLSILQTKNMEMKKVIDEKSQQIHKVKMQNLALLNLGGNGIHGNSFIGSKGSSSSHIHRLEEQLSTEKQINKSLRDRLEVMSSASSVVPSSLRSGVSDYAYMSSLLQEKGTQIDELKKQLQSQIRQTLEESDKVLELSRKLTHQESQTVRFKAEIYQLKMMIEDLKSEAKETPPPSNKARVKNNIIFEDLKFDEDKKGSADNKLDTNLSLYDIVDSKESKENVCKSNIDGASKKKNKSVSSLSNSGKKSVSMCDEVVVFDDESNKVIDLKNEETTKGLPKRTPKEHLAVSIEEHDEKMKNECAQQ